MGCQKRGGKWGRGGFGRGHCGALYSLLNVRKLLILWPAISAGQIELNFSLIAVEQLPAVAQRTVGQEACGMGHGASAAEGSFQNGRLLGPTGQLNAPIALWPLTQIANCQLQLAPPRRSIDRSIVASMPPSSLGLRLPCSALGHVLQTFCCRLLKVISLLRAACLSLPPPVPSAATPSGFSGSTSMHFLCTSSCPAGRLPHAFVAGRPRGQRRGEGTVSVAAFVALCLAYNLHKLQFREIKEKHKRCTKRTKFRKIQKIILFFFFFVVILVLIALAVLRLRAGIWMEKKLMKTRWR